MKKVLDINGQKAFPNYDRDGQPKGDYFFFVYDPEQQDGEGFFYTPSAVPVVEGQFEEMELPVYATNGGLKAETVKVKMPVIDQEAFTKAIEEALL